MLTSALLANKPLALARPISAEVALASAAAAAPLTTDSRALASCNRRSICVCAAIESARRARVRSDSVVEFEVNSSACRIIRKEGGEGVSSKGGRPL